MLKKILYLLILLIFILIKPAGAQNLPKSFSQEPVKFIEDISKYFESIFEKEKRKDAREFDGPIQTQMGCGKFNPERQQKIMAFANTMLKYKMRPMPHYFQYIIALGDFIETSPTDKASTIGSDS